MKTFVLLAATVAVCLGSAIPQDDGIGKNKTYPRFIEFPDAEGKMRLVDLQAPVDEAALEGARNGANNGYYLYTRNLFIERSEELIINNANSVRNSNFDFSRPVIVFVHGWTGSRSSDMNPDCRQAMYGQNWNIISLDWSRLARRDYVTATAGVPDVGTHLGNFMIFLNSLGVSWNNMHLVGFSLGAHVVGNAGRQCGGRIARITGLDPAGPGWGTLNRNTLRASDGVLTEAMHTDGGYTGLGIGSALCDVDFFPNGGSSQPGCLLSTCNHYRAYQLFASTIERGHLFGDRCTSNTQLNYNTCRGVRGQMGTHALTKSITPGMYRLDTGRSHPF